MSIVNSIARSFRRSIRKAIRSWHLRVREPDPVLAVAPLGWLGTILTLWCVYFFRDPPRVTPIASGLVISPADGRVSLVVNAVPPVELALGERALRGCRAS